MGKSCFIVGASRPLAGWAKIPASVLMVAEGCDFSHIHIEFPAGVVADHAVMFEARNGQVNFVNEATFDSKMETVRQYVVQCDEEEFYEVLAFCWKFCGIDYSYHELAGAIIAKAVGYLGQTIPNPFSDGMQTEMCSSLAARLLKISGIPVIGDVQSKSPRDIIDILENNGFERL